MSMKKIINFLGNMNKHGKEYLNLALCSFFTEGPLFEPYNMEDDALSLREIYKKIPEDFIYPIKLKESILRVKNCH